MGRLPAVTAENYFDSEIEMAYMGSTQIRGLMRCEAAELAKLQGVWQTRRTPSMLVGSYVDACFEGTLDAFRTSHPELFKRNDRRRSARSDPLTMEEIRGKLYGFMQPFLVSSHRYRQLRRAAK